MNIMTAGAINGNSMSEKDVPIKKKQIKDILRGLTWAEKLKVLEPLCETCRRKSRQEVYKEDRVKHLDEYPT